MQSSIGIDSKVLVREKIIAVRAALAFAASSAATIPSAFFWFGQITNQTLKAMISASHMPIPISLADGSTVTVELIRAGKSGFSYFTYASDDPSTFPRSLSGFDGGDALVGTQDLSADIAAP